MKSRELTLNKKVRVLLDNNPIEEPSFIEEGMNSLGYESLNEIFFDIYEIKSKGFEVVKEKKGELNGYPIVELDLSYNNQLYKNVRFVLSEQKGIKINPSLLDYTSIVKVENKSQKSKLVIEKKKPVSNDKLISSVLYSEKVKKPEVKKDKTKSQFLKENFEIEKKKNEFRDSLKSSIIEEIRNDLKKGIISDFIKENLQHSFNDVFTENGNDNKLHKILENYNKSFRKEYYELAEKVARREALRFGESGGGTNAAQYADGGTMRGDLTVLGTITGNTVVDIHGNTLLKKVIRDITGNDFVNGVYTVNHNLNTFNLTITLYYLNSDNAYEVAFASMVNKDVNTTEISFASQPLSTDNYKIVIMA